MQNAGEPVRIADLARKPILPDENGATYLLRAQDDITHFDNELAQVKYVASDNDIEGSYPPDSLVQIKGLIAAYPRILPLLEQAASCPEFSFQEDLTQGVGESFHIWSMPNISLIRGSTRYLNVYAELLLSEGNREKSLELSITSLKLSRHIKKDHLTVNHLVATAMGNIALVRSNTIIQSGPINEQSRFALEKELSLQVMSAEDFQKTLQTERAIVLDFSHPEAHSRWLGFGRDNSLKLELLDVFQDFSKYSKVLYSDYLADGNYISHPAAAPQSTPSYKESPMVFHSVKTQLQYSIQSMMITEKKFQAGIKSLRIINALQRNAISEDKRIPRMADLGLPEEVDIDPFNGKPMIVKKLPQGWLVYSVGDDLQDNGGDLNDQYLDVGLGPKIPKAENKEKESAPTMQAK
jgi:hypothetical protein